MSRPRIALTRSIPTLGSGQAIALPLLFGALGRALAEKVHERWVGEARLEGMRILSCLDSFRPACRSTPQGGNPRKGPRA
jgi:hypothetical protein